MYIRCVEVWVMIYWSVVYPRNPWKSGSSWGAKLVTNSPDAVKLGETREETGGNLKIGQIDLVDPRIEHNIWQKIEISPMEATGFVYLEVEFERELPRRIALYGDMPRWALPATFGPIPEEVVVIPLA